MISTLKKPSTKSTLAPEKHEVPRQILKGNSKSTPLEIPLKVFLVPFQWLKSGGMAKGCLFLVTG